MRDVEAKSPLEQFAVPHQFQPRLSLFGATVAITAALTRIFLGSLIGALWGVEIWLAAVSRHSNRWQSLVILTLAAGLVASIAALMWAIAKGVIYLEHR